MANESGTPTTLDLARPSFTDFWKKSKSEIGGGASKIRFVESKTPSQGSGRKTSGDGGKGGGGGTTPAESSSSSSPSPPSQQQQQQHQSPPNTDNGNDNSNNANTTQQPQQPLDKAQLRRLQVRRAQTQHRQRKANYIRQLETDVARLRDMIEAAEKDTRDLAKENEQLRKKAMEAAISGAKIGGGGGAAGAAASAIPSPGSSSGMTAGLLSPTSSLSMMTTKQTATLQTPRQIPLSLDQEVEMIMGESAPPAPADVGEFTVSLGFDEAINAPTFYVCVAESVGPPAGPPAITVSPPASAVYPPPGTQPQALQRQQHQKQGQQQHSQATTTTTSSAGTTTSPNYNNHDDLPDLTPAQTQAAINFILALEHICRLHFHPTTYDPSPEGQLGDPPPPLAGFIQLPRGGGHSLMATSLALHGAPGKKGNKAFQAAWRSTKGLRWVPGLGMKLGSVPPLPEMDLVGTDGLETEEEGDRQGPELLEGGRVPGLVAMEWEGGDGERRGASAAAGGHEEVMMMDVDSGMSANGHGPVAAIGTRTGTGTMGTAETPRIAATTPAPAPPAVTGRTAPTPHPSAHLAMTPSASTPSEPPLPADHDHDHHHHQQQQPQLESPSPPDDPNAIPSWRTSALTLRALHGLAATLASADPDGAELTPVQAWFELARRVGHDRLLVPSVLEALKRELHGLVKCRMYGACMRRDEFEGVVGRVLGLDS
ncbi:hypothetical protein VTJ04DRAFT_935 [Mycothermus thermophilus]|uniref:uncharacterized protein n=1 Tax=Humicola insolens TaxID=85995 RepID=UPI0037428675